MEPGTLTQCPQLGAGKRDDRQDSARENDGRVSRDSNPSSTANTGLCSHTRCCKQGQGRRKTRDERVHVPATSSLKKSQGGKGEEDSRGIRMGCVLNLHVLPERGGTDISPLFTKD